MMPIEFRSEAAVLLRDHAVQHRNREHGVDTRGHAGQLRRRSLLFRWGGHPAPNPPLGAAQDEPYVGTHGNAGSPPHAERVDALMESAPPAPGAPNAINN